MLGSVFFLFRSFFFLLRPGNGLVHGLVDEPLAVDVGVVHTLQSSIQLADVNPGQLANVLDATRHTQFTFR